MDYCYDPNASLAQMSAGGTTTAGTTTQAVSGGCSAEVHACPGGGIVFRDPTNNCEFEPCPNSETKSTTTMNQPTTTLPANEATSSYYCGYNMNQVNNNCHKAIACPSGLNTDCPGLEVCIKDTNCDSSSSTTTTTATATPFPTTEATSTSAVNETTPVTTIVVTTNMTTATEDADVCDTLCLDILPPEFCPEVLDLPSCLEIEVGQVCESDGECATTDQLNNCGTYDIYVRVECGGSTPTQGELMNALQVTPTETATLPATTTAVSTTAATNTTSITTSTESPSNSTTPAPEVNTTVAPVGTTTTVAEGNETVSLDTGNMTSEASQMFAPVSVDPTLSSVESLLEAASNQEASTPPTEPPVESLISNAAANFNYDRSPVEEDPVLDEQSPTYSLYDTSNNDPSYSGSDSVSSSGFNEESAKDPWSNNVGWDFDTYFTSTLQNSATNRVFNASLCVLTAALVIGIL